MSKYPLAVHRTTHEITDNRN